VLSDVASLIERLRICYREGWLGAERRNHGKDTRGFKERGQRVSAKLAEMR
jgi:hypothetical protein